MNRAPAHRCFPAARPWVAWGCMGVHGKPLVLGVLPELDRPPAPRPEPGSRRRPARAAPWLGSHRPRSPTWRPPRSRAAVDILPELDQLQDVAAVHFLPEQPADLEAAADEPGDRRSPRTPPLFLGGINQQGRHVLTERAPPVRVASHRRPM